MRTTFLTSIADNRDPFRYRRPQGENDQIPKKNIIQSELDPYRYATHRESVIYKANYFSSGYFLDFFVPWMVKADAHKI